MIDYIPDFGDDFAEEFEIQVPEEELPDLIDEVEED